MLSILLLLYIDKYIYPKVSFFAKERCHIGLRHGVVVVAGIVG
jgi:hypothetical protein